MGRVAEMVKELLNEQKMKLKDVAISVSGISLLKINLPTMTDMSGKSINGKQNSISRFDINDNIICAGTTDTKMDKVVERVLLVAARRQAQHTRRS
jgi:hypothetical protein